MEDSFYLLKNKQLVRDDRSSIGSWDIRIAPLCNKINKNKNYYTTSSCSGRVVLLKASDVKQPDAFLFRTHKKITFKELRKALDEISKNGKYNGMVEFQQTCCILHVSCKTLSDAQKLVDFAKLSGWKRSGIMGGKRNMVELHSTESMSFPIMDKGKMLVDDNYLKIIVLIANNKLERVWKKIDRLKGMI